jgi:hypothetical protein
MSCRRICRELLWLARFGEFGPSSQPHLDHLAGCRSCRDEVGFDRAMVEQLRIALASRVENANPPATTWDRILARAQTPEPRPAERLWVWSTGLVGRLRFATAMAGTGLALVLAMNTQIVPADLGVTGDASAVENGPAALLQVPRVAPAPSSLSRLARQWGGAEAGVERPDPEAALTSLDRLAPETEPERASAAPTLRIAFRPMQTPEPGAEPAPGNELGGSPQDRGSELGEPS